MSFPNYNRTLEDVSFSDLAKYSNNDQDGDISLFQCASDIKSTSTLNVGLANLTGWDKYTNITGSSNNRKGRFESEVDFRFTNDFRVANTLRVMPSTDPFGNPFDDTISAMLVSTLKITDITLCLVCEEDDLEAPATSPPNTKVDRYMLGTNATTGEQASNTPYTHNRVNTLNSFSIPTSALSQTNMYGVPNRFFLDQITIEHDANGSNNYWMWFAITFSIATSGDSYGWNESRTVISYSAWKGVFVGSGSAFTTQNTGMTALPSLEGSFAPVDSTSGNYLSGLNNNFADFKILIEVDCGFWI